MLPFKSFSSKCFAHYIVIDNNKKWPSFLFSFNHTRHCQTSGHVFVSVWEENYYFFCSQCLLRKENYLKTRYT
jgi:hypothetical protein